jgi:hypothetical protein
VTDAPSDEYRPLTRSMRALLYTAGVLVFLAGVQLFVFPLRTERYFAWTIKLPMTAVFLGASYWSALAFEWSAARQRLWANARIAVPTVFVFTTLTLVATLVHADLFHFGPANETSTRIVTWVWLGIYVVVPVMMVLLMVLQSRQPGIDPPRGAQLGWPIRVVIGAEAVLLCGIGLALFIRPVTGLTAVWPWPLTPLTSRAIGAWCLGLGVAAVHALWENCVTRLRPAAYAFLVFGVLQTIALLRFGEALDWDRPASWVYVAFLASAAWVGATVLWQSRRRPVS